MGVAGDLDAGLGEDPDRAQKEGEFAILGFGMGVALTWLMALIFASVILGSVWLAVLGIALPAALFAGRRALWRRR